MEEQKHNLTEKVVNSDKHKKVYEIIQCGLISMPVSIAGGLAYSVISAAPEAPSTMEYFKYGSIGAAVGIAWTLMNYFDSGY